MEKFVKYLCKKNYFNSYIEDLCEPKRLIIFLLHKLLRALYKVDLGIAFPL